MLLLSSFAILAIMNTQMAPPPPPLAGPWRLVSLTGHEPGAIAGLRRPANIVFRDDGHVAGSFGCNGFGGTYSIEGDRSDRLVFGALAGTMMACPQPAMSIENAMRKALTGSVPFALSGNRLTLTAASGVTLIFEKQPASKARPPRAGDVPPK